MVSVLEYAPDATSLDPPISDCSALEPPANAAISTSSPSSAKYLRCCAMISGRYGRPSEAVATLTLRFSGVDWAFAACGSAESSAAAKRAVTARRVADMGVLQGCGASHRLPPSVDTMRSVAKLLFNGRKLFRTRIDDRPQLGAVEHALHLRGQPALAGDPRLHGRRIVGNQFVGPGDAGNAQAGGPALVVVGLVEAEARARRHADAVERHDA